MPPVVSTDRLTKDFPVGFWRTRPHRALDGLSLSIESGEVFGVLGPNGAGKSTTLKLLTNLLWPTSGRASVLGRPPGDVVARQRLGFLPEHPTFYDQLTAIELLSYYAGLFGYSRADRVIRTQHVLEMTGLANDGGRPLRHYSAGMLQRMGLAQALINDPELVLFDEPMAGLDPVGRHDVRDLILRLRDEGRTVLFSTHILADAEWLCSRVAILSRGKLVAVGRVPELVAGTRRGCEIVVSETSPDVVDRLRPRTLRTTRLSEGRYAFHLAVDTRPEPFIADLTAAGARLESVTAVRTSLEDVFIERVGGGGAAAHGS